MTEQIGPSWWVNRVKGWWHLA